MDAIFPLPQKDKSPLTNFLDRAVTAKLDLVWKRAVAPAAEVTGIIRKTTSGLEFGTGDRMLPKDQGLTNGNGIAPSITPKEWTSVMFFSRTSPGVVVGEEANGKTVRSLSRLCRYLGGCSPDE